MKKALVLGGGGIVGVAWETAVLAGLMDGGVDVRDADIIVGTSAGSIVGTQIARGRDPREMMGDNRARAREAPAARRMPSPEEMMPVFRAWGSFDEMTDAACAVVGAAAIATPTMSEEEYLAGFAVNGEGGWPATPLLITAVDCASGALRVFDATSGVPIELAMAASCAVPGMFPPVTIEGRRYTDGGLRSGTSADLAQRVEPDSVLVIAPMGGGESRIGMAIARSMAREIAALEAAGATVQLVQFDDATRAAGGANLMSAVAGPAASIAGEAQGQRIAAEVSAIWR